MLSFPCLKHGLLLHTEESKFFCWALWALNDSAYCLPYTCLLNLSPVVPWSWSCLECAHLGVLLNSHKPTSPTPISTDHSNHVVQGSANNAAGVSWASPLFHKSSFIEHSHANLLIYSLWLQSWAVESIWPAKSKILPVDFYRKGCKPQI